MKLKKLMLSLVSGALACTMFAGCGSGSSSESDSSQAADTVTDAQTEKKEETAEMVDVKLLGRTYLADDGKIWLGLSGTGVDFEYTGDKLSLFMIGNPTGRDNGSRVGVYVDGERVKDMIVTGDAEIFDIDGKGSTPVNVKIVKLSECPQSCCGIVKINPNGGTVKAAADKPHKIEIIGDSITCGYGVDENDPLSHFTTPTEDCTKSYSIKTAELLNADYSLVSFSGYGIVSGYTESGNKVADSLVPLYYEKYGFTYGAGFGAKKPQDMDWDFSKFVPDAVVINLGTNDSTYAKNDERREEYKQGYISFLKTIRSKNPNARIFCTLGIMGTSLNKTMHEAAEAYTAETGDNNISVFDFPEQNGNADGLAADYHPSEKTHTKSAEMLAEFIKKEMGW